MGPGAKPKEGHDSIMDLDIAYTYLQSLRFTNEINAAWPNLVVGAVAFLVVKEYQQLSLTQLFLPNENTLYSIAYRVAHSPTMSDVFDKVNGLSQEIFLMRAVESAISALYHGGVVYNNPPATPKTRTLWDHYQLVTPMNHTSTPSWVEVSSQQSFSRPLDSGYCLDAINGEVYPPSGHGRTKRDRLSSLFAAPPWPPTYVSPSLVSFWTEGLSPASFFKASENPFKETVSHTLPISIPPMISSSTGFPTQHHSSPVPTQPCRSLPPLASATFSLTPRPTQFKPDNKSTPAVLPEVPPVKERSGGGKRLLKGLSSYNSLTSDTEPFNDLASSPLAAKSSRKQPKSRKRKSSIARDDAAFKGPSARKRKSDASNTDTSQGEMSPKPPPRKRRASKLSCVLGEINDSNE